MRLVKQKRYCGVFDSQETCYSSFAVILGTLFTALAVAIAIFNLLNNPNIASSTTTATTQQPAVTLSTEEQDLLAGLKQSLVELRDNLSSSREFSASQHLSVTAKLLELEGSLDNLAKAAGAGSTESSPPVDQQQAAVSEDGSSLPTVLPAGPISVEIYPNCSIELLNSCTVDRQPVNREASNNISFSTCTVSYSNEESLDLSESPTVLSNFFCSITSSGNFTSPVTSSLQYDMDMNEWSCLCNGFLIQGFDFTEFECQLYATSCPDSITLPL